MSEVLSSNVRGGALAYVSGAHRYSIIIFRMDFLKKPLVATMS